MKILFTIFISCSSSFKARSFSSQVDVELSRRQQLQIELQSQGSMVSQLQQNEQSLQQELNILRDQYNMAGDELRQVKEDVKTNDSQMQVNKS